MKKIVAVVVITICLVIGALYAPGFVDGNLAKSPTTRLANINYVDSVSVTGVVSKKDSKVIKSETPLVISKVLVSNGQEVAIGQPVITVDQIATTKKMIELKQNSSVSATSIDNTSYESAMALIPKEVISNEAGIIENVNFSDGQYVAANDVIASLNGSDGLIINSSISENYISKVKVGQPVIITGSGFSTKKYNGVVDSISNVAKKQYVGTTEDTVVDVKIRFTDADDAIRVGYSAKVKILTSDYKKINVVPYEAVLEDDKNIEYVYVFNNGIAVRKNVKIGMELGQGVEIVDGINPNDNILTSPKNVAQGDYVLIVKG